jgi:hypothetical protein
MVKAARIALNNTTFHMVKGCCIAITKRVLEDNV